MKNHIQDRFTLIELLAVIAIIAILAGLLVPAVMGAQTQARITQAKSDMATITQALRALEGAYGKLYGIASGARGRTTMGFGGKDFNTSGLDGSSSVARSTTRNGNLNANAADTYDYMIVELSDPTARNFTPSVNKRKIRFLDPRADYVPNNGVGDPRALWRDPWGNRYMVFFCIDNSNTIEPHNGHTLSADLAMYSAGPNATDDYGTNKELDPCKNIAGADDIATWHK